MPVWRTKAIKSLEGCKVSLHAIKRIKYAIELECLLFARTHLELEDLSLTGLPPIVCEISSLYQLECGKNQLESLPSAIGQLAQLQFLELHENKLLSLPSEIGKLTQLHGLKLCQNELKSLPAEFENLESLHYLSCLFNRIETFPVEVCRLKNLNHLILSGNQLQTIPSEIGLLTQLINLELSANYLRTVPPEISLLTSLQRLRLNVNALQSLPPELGFCTSLQSLDVSDNLTLHELPLSLGQISRLTEIDESRTSIPFSVRNALLEQCKRRRAQLTEVELPGRLHTWSTVAKSSLSLNGLSRNEQIILNEWLIRLERTRDFSRSQERLATIVCKILQSVTENAEFRELFFVQAEANITRCEDRAAMALNEIYTSWIITFLPADLEEKLIIMIQAAKTVALRCELGKLIPGHERESVEIYLYYETLFKFQSAIENMAHESIGRRSWIDEEALLQAVEETCFTHLLAIPAFDRLAKQELHEEWEQLLSKAYEQLEQSGELEQGEVLQDLNERWSEVCRNFLILSTSLTL